MIEWVCLIVGVLTVVCAWDAFRRYLQAARLRQADLDRIAAIEAAQHRMDTQVQNVLQKLNAAQLGSTNRMPRIAR